MSNQSKENAEQAQKFFKQVGEYAEEIKKAIPDKQLGEKLKKVQEGASEVVKHIEEKTGGNA